MPHRFFFRLLSSAVPAGDHVPDGELLRRFARDRDTAALELLVHRHADAVWTACRCVVRCDADAEDAFQATFLVLARKAGSVRAASAGGWLHRVAVNAALKLRERSSRVAVVTTEQLDALPALRRTIPTRTYPLSSRKKSPGCLSGFGSQSFCANSKAYRGREGAGVAGRDRLQSVEPGAGSSPRPTGPSWGLRSRRDASRARSAPRSR